MAETIAATAEESSRTSSLNEEIENQPISTAPLVILKKGWLHKLSYRGKGWKKRYVEITDCCELRYGREIRAQGTPSAKATMYELKGVISLEDALIVEVSPKTFLFYSIWGPITAQ
jgi:hypothetical protein